MTQVILLDLLPFSLGAAPSTQVFAHFLATLTNSLLGITMAALYQPSLCPILSQPRQWQP